MKKTIVITGASDGIGAAAARQLSAKGEQVVIVGRSEEKTAAVAKQLNAPYHVADYADLAQVRRLADELRAAYPRIDVLANNAGGLFKQAITKDGFPNTFQVNYLAEFLLTHLLLDRLVESHAKVIQTSSIGARWLGSIEIEDFIHNSSKNPLKAYGDSKLANILFTKELHRRYHSKGINAVAFHPGNIASSFGHDFQIVQRIYRSPIGRLLLSKPDEGGSALTWLVEGTPGRTWISGEYYENNELPPAWKINRQANDAELARKLWERSAELVGLPTERTQPSAQADVLNRDR